jgi:septal ring factor EnvC (AmiA/AmiB activator)
MRQISVTALLLLLASAGVASAADSDNFRLEKSANGYVRMDTRTGEMSICEEKWGELVCRLAADERTAVQDEIESLQTELDSLEARLAQIATLENRVAQLENSLTARIEKTLPTEEDFNQTMSYMERFFRGFIGIVKDLEGENSKPATPGADRT